MNLWGYKWEAVSRTREGRVISRRAFRSKRKAIAYADRLNNVAWNVFRIYLRELQLPKQEALRGPHILWTVIPL
jgi:hypothetical protein